ncbi:MAG: D-glycero-beta-D-manno-heptose 1-phosphate adenylyltransferase [Candidatus Omnitrophica bacterium 4484_70.2]|nr:MAG: D-glycero-beta-D-manno-heptose 1-phosphate adenylyltransferase [Candidatus Omnitrophica bacterium 4484_70.2]
MGKILKLSSLLRELRVLRKKKKKIVFTNGCFDILHQGHIYLLKKAKSFGDVLVVGLNSDSSVRRIKGESRPIKDEVSRAKILSSIRFVDYVVIFKEDTPFRLIKVIKPDVLVKGGDWKLKDIVGREILKTYGGKIKRIKYLKGFSTTQLIKKCQKY